MLRHIISVSLAMTACASLIPTKANAVTFTLEAFDGLYKRPGESIDFVLKVTPNRLGSVDEVEITNISYNYDQNELSLVPGRPHEIIEFGRPFSMERVIAYFLFNVDRPVKDEMADISALVQYRVNRGSVILDLTYNSSLDVQPVPEPLTIFGTATGLVCGALFKRKFSKKTVA
jgi:hypothetical protein